MGQRESLVDGADMRHTVPGIDHHSRNDSLRVQRQHCLNGNVRRIEAVLLEHHFDHFLGVLERIHRRFGEQHFGVGRIDVHLFGAERVVPDVAHVVPVPDDSVFHWVVDLELGAQLGRLVADHEVLRILICVRERGI